MISFELSEEQKAIQKVAREFAEKEIRPVAPEYDEEEKYPERFVETAFKAGMTYLYVPEEYGGQGMDFLTACIVGEEIAWGCCGFATILGANNLGTTPLLVAGTEEQKAKYFGALTSRPSLAAMALTEPGAGSDAAGVKTTAVRDGDEYVLNGTKCFISNGGIADLTTVFASTDTSAGVRGLSCFLVPKENPGISGGKKERKMGVRASQTSEVILSDCRVPAGDLLGEEGKGFKIAMITLDKARVSVACNSVGIARAAMEAAVEYARERVQFGRPIAENQAVQFMLADMAMEIEAARLMYMKAAWMETQGLPFSTEAAYAKTFCSDMAMRVTTDVVQVFGGYGYMRDYPVEKYMRDAKINQIWDGTNQIQRIVMARSLLGR
ncbi:MAG: acyl-CoA dehydrogenase family protein [Actinomycetota bacterium]|nr:acyl-CoA dehydrogenase family protein [Actinomycetota bacterium]MDD5667030.1 acyl-CoA dehydrogenase family protein [Actinomycetota bacterium]